MSDSVFKVAIVGAGFFSQFHYDAWSRIDNTKIQACCDLDIDKARSVAEKFQIQNAYTDLDELLKNNTIDLLDIVSPPPTHLQNVKLAAQKGINVVCQKPFGETLEQAQEITRIADEMGIEVIVHDNFRFMPWYRKIKSVLEQGILGDVLNAQFNLRPGDGQGEDAYLSRQPYFQQMEKFLIHETAIHFIDTFRYLFGEVTSVYADLRRCNPVIKGEDSGVVIFELASGMRAVFDGNRLIDHSSSNTRRTMGEMWIEGTKAVLSLDGEGRIWLREHGSLQLEPVEYQWQDQGYGGDCVFALCQHVKEYFRDHGSVENKGREYLVNIELENAVYQSNKEGRKITL